MSPRPWFVSLLLSAGSLLAADNANPIEFSGVLALPGKTTFHLDHKSSQASAWLAIGDTFEGYVISSYDASTETITLTRNGAVIRVRLKNAKVLEGQAPAKPDPALAEQQKQAILRNLRMLGGAADQYFLRNRVKTATYDDLVGSDKYIKALNPVDGENYSSMKFEQGKKITITTPNGVTIDYLQ